MRTAAFQPPTSSEHLSQKLHGFAAYDPDRHEINVLKPFYGLEDAPQAWRQRLQLALGELKLVN